MPAKPKPTKADRPKKRKKKTPRQQIIRELDDVVRRIVFRRDENCIPLVYRGIETENSETLMVNHSGVAQLGHIISRARLGCRWDLYNCHKQDASDNLLHEYYPEVMNQWFIRNFGLPKWNELVNASTMISKYSMDDLETLLFELVEIEKMMDDEWKPYFSQADIMAGRWKK